ncbi:MAG: hypothetical protein IIU58_03435 [Clostridia bacterium]|nr:hypothetical protein [Clostridia bacterium]
MFDFLFKKLRGTSDKETSVAEDIVAPAPEAAPDNEAPTAEPVAETAPTEDLAIIAVLAAAVAAASGRDPSAFRVVSFKRANKNFSYGK